MPAINTQNIQQCLIRSHTLGSKGSQYDILICDRAYWSCHEFICYWTRIRKPINKNFIPSVLMKISRQENNIVYPIGSNEVQYFRTLGTISLPTIIGKNIKLLYGNGCNYELEFSC